MSASSQWAAPSRQFNYLYKQLVSSAPHRWATRHWPREPTAIPMYQLRWLFLKSFSFDCNNRRFYSGNNSGRWHISGNVLFRFVEVHFVETEKGKSLMLYGRVCLLGARLRRRCVGTARVPCLNFKSWCQGVSRSIRDEINGFRRVAGSSEFGAPRGTADGRRPRAYAQLRRAHSAPADPR